MNNSIDTIIDPVHLDQHLTQMTTVSVKEINADLDKRIEKLKKQLKECRDYDVNIATLEPFARFTFAKAGIASFFVDGGIGFGCEYTNYEGEMLDSTAWGFSIGFKPGVKLSITDNLSLVAKLGFLGYEKFEAADGYPDASSYDSFGLGVDGDALSIGMYWSF